MILRKPDVLLLLFFLIGSIHVSYSQRTFVRQDESQWNEEATPNPADLVHSVILIGDIKYPSEDATVLKLLKTKLDQAGAEGSLLLLGDIVYPQGLPDLESSSYFQAKSDLDTLIHYIGDFKGKTIILPGNHDWNKGRNGGWDHVLNEESYFHELYGSEDVYFPGGGCPGPVEYHLSDDLVVIAFDSQWWFQQAEKGGPEDGCEFEDIAGLFVSIEDLIRRNEDKKIIFATHHPVYSAGNHGGYFSPSRWIFPLLDINRSLYVPLPGFLYTWYRKFLGSVQDMAHPEYKILSQTLISLFKQYPDIIYAAGHEHNLQFLQKDSLHHIISGGGGDATYIRKKGKKAQFAHSGRGLSVIQFYKNGDVWTEFWSAEYPEKDSVIFRKKLFNKPIFDPSEKEAIIRSTSLKDSVVQITLSDLYEKGKFVRFWMGDNYRDIWNMPVKLPVFDISSEKGGLTILKRGGGQQTKSVRLEDKTGKQYVLRSVNKYVEKALEVELRNTIAEDAVQDAISASHPFAALTIPSMADAAGVMHTNPRIVWVPDDPNLGIYRKDLANNVFLFEERPAGNRDDIDSFDNSENIVNTDKVVKKTMNDHDHQVDQESVARARIFDLFLNDWDRHDDQWRWASFKGNDITVYKPIPRDRDQVFFVNQGVVMWLARQDFMQPKFQGFDYKIKNVKGLGYNARYFDRSFITEPSLDKWLEISSSIRTAMTDSVIHTAMSALPEEIYQISGKEIEEKLKSRRNYLDGYAEGIYRFISKEVDVLGTNEREYFHVTRKPNGNTLVTIWGLSKKKGKLKDQLYKREFKMDETEEIRLYGLSGKDKFIIDGEAGKAIKVRLIAGKNNDTVIDHSRISGPSKSLLVYDRKDKKNYIQKGKETRLKLSRDKSVNEYDRKQYKFDKTMPILGAGFNVDDGFFISGGVNIRKYNFRDSTQHKISAVLAFATQAFGISYEGNFSSFSRYFDLEVQADLSMPRNVDNFFGIGNETERLTEGRSYHRVRYEYAYVNPRLSHAINENITYKVGVYYQYFSVTDTSGKFIGDPELSNLDSSSYNQHHFTGLHGDLEIDTRNSKVLPSRGVHWITRAQAYYGISETDKNFVKLRSDLRFYLSITRDPRVVFAFRFGGAMNLGGYEFFHANFLGGRTNLRGFQSNRFAGDHSFYQNTEVRLKLMNLRSYVFNGQTGVYLSNDFGRVWVEGEKSDRWHNGVGIGIWITPFEFTALTLSYNMSNEDKMVVFNFRFLF